MSADNESGVSTPPVTRRRKPRQRTRRISESDSDYEEEVVSRKPRTHPRSYRSDNHSHPRRRLKSAHQLSVLQAFFDNNTKPSKDEINELAENTALSFQEIQRWFRNERHKHKKAHGDDYEESSSNKKSPRRKRSRATDISSSPGTQANKTTNKKQRSNTFSALEHSDSSSPNSPHPHSDSSAPSSPSNTSVSMTDSPGPSPLRATSPDHEPLKLNATVKTEIPVIPPILTTQHSNLNNNSQPTVPSSGLLNSNNTNNIPQITSSYYPSSTTLRRPLPIAPNPQLSKFLNPQSSPTSSPDSSGDYFELSLPMLPDEIPYSPIGSSDVDGVMSPSSNFTWDMLADLTMNITPKDFVDIYLSNDLQLSLPQRIA